MQPAAGHRFGAGAETVITELAEKIRTEIELCRGSAERAERALAILLQYAAADRGFLYLNGPKGFNLAAASRGALPSDELDLYLREWLTASIATDEDAVTQTIVASYFQEKTLTYEIVELRADRGGWFGIIGALALAREGKQHRVIPFAALNPLAQALVTAGDAQIMGRAPGAAAPRRPSTPSPSP